jgi:hypothetical protein
MVRMAKSWNRTENKIIKPSFLIVMALDLLRPLFTAPQIAIRSAA